MIITKILMTHLKRTKRGMPYQLTLIVGSLDEVAVAEAGAAVEVVKADEADAKVGQTNALSQENATYAVNSDTGLANARNGKETTIIEKHQGLTAVLGKKLHGESLVSEALTTESPRAVRDAGWYMDSGASDHMTNRRDWFANYEAFEPPLQFALAMEDSSKPMEKEASTSSCSTEDNGTKII